MTRNFTRFVIATLALILTAGAGAVSRAPVALSSRVRVAGASLTLADLLPANAPDVLRSRAAGIPLGAAPLPGSSRRLSRAEIARDLGQELARKLEIPQSIVVERDSRELSRREVFEAIRAALARNGFEHAGELTPADVRLAMPVEVTTEDAGLRVLGMQLDPALHLAVFRMWTAKEADVRPFDVFVRPVGGLKPWLTQATGVMHPAGGQLRLVRTQTGFGVAPAEAWRARKPRRKPLVLPWQTASLLLLSGTMEIHTTAEPLERGYLGQVIRVRMNKTKQVFRAKVIAPDCLEAKF